MAEYIMARGSKIKCMAKAFLLGVMDEHIKDFIPATKSMVMVNKVGLMEQSTKANG